MKRLERQDKEQKNLMEIIRKNDEGKNKNKKNDEEKEKDKGSYLFNFIDSLGKKKNSDSKPKNGISGRVNDLGKILVKKINKI